MELYISYVLFVMGIIMIIKGSDWFVDSAVWGAKVFGIPELIIGATIISICTTLPETIVAVTAAVQNETDMVVGNALGSIAANTGLILAIMFIFSKEKAVISKAYKVNGVFLVLVLSFVWVLGIYIREISRLTTVILLGLLVLFLYKNFKEIWRMNKEGSNSEESKLRAKDKEEIPRKETMKYIGLFIIGLILVVWGARLVVDKGILIAESLGVPTIVIAIVFTSLGTSLPELITAISAIKKGAVQIGMGNIIGANVLNLLQVIGFAALITPIDLTKDKSVLFFQFPAVIVLTAIALFLNWNNNKSLRKISGILLLVLYLLFLIVNIFREVTPFIGPLIF